MAVRKGGSRASRRTAPARKSQGRGSRNRRPRAGGVRITPRKSACDSRFRPNYGLRGESARGQFGQIATTGGPDVWKSFIFTMMARRHLRFDPCSVNVCTGTRADNNCI